MHYSARYASPLGPILLASDGKNITGLWMEGQKYFLGPLNGKPEENPDLHAFKLAREWLDSYFEGKKPAIAPLPLAPLGASEFRTAVWEILCEIPCGKVATYGEISKRAAKQLGRKKIPALAVGGAVGHNPISIIIPCHRVVGHDGSLTGYAGGLGKKIKLLELEGADMSKLYVPKKERPCKQFQMCYDTRALRRIDSVGNGL